MASPYTIRKVGQPHTLEHRVYIEKDGIPVSPFHDIPLFANAEQTILNMVVEIPRWTNAKLEVSCFWLFAVWKLCYPAMTIPEMVLAASFEPFLFLKSRSIC